MDTTHKLAITAVYLGQREDKPRGDEKPWKHFAWEVTLTYGAQHMREQYKCGLAHVIGYRSQFGRVRTADELRRASKLTPGTVAWEEATKNPVPRPPSAFDVLYSLLSDARCYDDARSFEDFCSELGYDSDSRTAERIYRACGETSKQLRWLLGSEFEHVIGLDEDALQAWCAERAGEAVSQ